MGTASRSLNLQEIDLGCTGRVAAFSHTPSCRPVLLMAVHVNGFLGLLSPQELLFSFVETPCKISMPVLPASWDVEAQTVHAGVMVYHALMDQTLFRQYMSQSDAPSKLHMLPCLIPVHEHKSGGVVVVDHDCSMPM